MTWKLKVPQTGCADLFGLSDNLHQQRWLIKLARPSGVDYQITIPRQDGYQFSIRCMQMGWLFRQPPPDNVVIRLAHADGVVYQTITSR